MNEIKNTSSPAKIKFLGYRCAEFEFKASEDYLAGTSVDEFNLQFDHGGLKNMENKNRFMLSFQLKISDEAGTSLSCHFMGVFESTTEVDDEFMESPFLRINAPAILFPYIRSYVSTVTINGGLDPIILPTINFTANNQNKKS